MPVAYAFTPLPGPAPTGSSPTIAPAPPGPPEGILAWFFSTFPWLRDKAFVKRWGKIVGIGVLALGLLVAIMTSGDPSTPPSKATQVLVPVLIPGGGASDEEKFKAAAYELDKGKTCEARKAAVAKLRDLGDARAVPLLKRARYRMRGGVLGVGDANTNKCLKADAEAAMAALGAPVK
jgi:hypothetical protein